jgi:hypothetical protein
LLYAQELFYIQQNGNYIRFREPDVIEMSGQLLINVTALRSFGAGVTNFGESTKYYIVDPIEQKTLIADPLKGLTLDFVEKVDGLVIVINKITYISAELVFRFLNFEYKHDERYYVYKPHHKLYLQEARIDGRTVKLEFSDSFFDENAMVKVLTKGNQAEIILFPVDISSGVVQGLTLQQADSFLSVFTVDFNVPVEYQINRVGSSVAVYFSHVDPYLEEIEAVASGIQWYRKREKLGGYTLRVSYLEIDLKTADIAITPEIALGGIGYKEKVSSMAKRNTAYAAINGCYFDTVTNFPIGILIKDEKLLSEPYYYPRPFFIQTKDGKYSILNLDTEIQLNLGSSLFLIKGVNKFSKNGDVIIYTEEFSQSIPKQGDREYVVVVDNRVISKEYVSRAPKNGFVVMLSPIGVSKYVKIGDSTEIRTIVSGYPYEILFAIEGGPQIIEGGRLVESIETEKVRYGERLLTSRTPRTVVAIAPDKLYFIVIDGYQSQSAGLTIEELATFLLSKGFTDAMCLDGGSSSTMVIKSRVVNNPPGGEPEIPVGILINPK